METKTMNIEVILTEEALGMANANPDIHREHIASRSADAAKVEEELAALPLDDLEQKQKTVFPRDDKGRPFFWDYQLRGWLKDSIGMMLEIKGSAANAAGLTRYGFRRAVDGLMFVNPRKIPILLPEGGMIGECVRPLRAETLRGPRVALASSETVPAGSSLCFEVLLFDRAAKKPKKGEEEKAPPGSLEAVVLECLDYGAFRGLGQWRNSGKGRFSYRILPGKGEGK
jgi:hypothetical protein